MTTIFVQFADSTNAVIVAAFTCEQDSKTWPNQGTVDSTDPKWATYYATIPSNCQSAWPAPPAST